MLNYFFIRNEFIIRNSRPLLKNVFNASSDDNTISSPFMLNEVLRIIGMPLIFSNSSITL